jgi:hypothetical protein
MGVGDVGLQTSELAHHLYQLGTNRAPSLHDLTAMHLLGDRSDALTEPTLPVDVAGDHQQEDLAKQIFAADWRVHGTEGERQSFGSLVLYPNANSGH